MDSEYFAWKEKQKNESEISTMEFAQVYSLFQLREDSQFLHIKNVLFSRKRRYWWWKDYYDNDDDDDDDEGEDDDDDEGKIVRNGKGKKTKETI